MKIAEHIESLNSPTRRYGNGYIRGHVKKSGRQWIWRITGKNARELAWGEEFTHEHAIEAASEACVFARAWWNFSRDNKRFGG